MKIKRGGGSNSNGDWQWQWQWQLPYIVIICLLVAVCVFLYWMYNNGTNNGSGGSQSPQKVVQNVSITNERQQLDDAYNLYAPPLRNTYPYPFSNRSNRRNRSTWGDNSFTQMGILKYKTVGTDETTFLPLFGRPLSTSRDQWQYYTVSNTGPGIKLSIRNAKGRDLMDETGGPELYNDDSVIVDGYDKTMNATIYKQKPLYYI